ncbi:MAG: hypothetical protein ACXWUH_19600 [Burkholderiales bacterium]
MRTLAALLILLAPAVPAAQVNKCLDNSGKVVGYAAECPSGTRPEQTGIRSAPATQTPAQKSIAERDADFRKRQMEKKEAADKSAKTSAEAQQRKEACESSQAYLRSLQSGQRIRRTDPKTGEPSFLADAEYPKEIANAQRAVAAHCK